jgi:hypothetical protein
LHAFPFTPGYTLEHDLPSFKFIAHNYLYNVLTTLNQSKQIVEGIKWLFKDLYKDVNHTKYSGF